MKVLKWLSVSILALFVLFLIISAFLPSNYRIEKKINIVKHPDIVFQATTDNYLREKWDPLVQRDPNAIIINNFKDSIIGSGYSWSGEIIGKGKLTIKEFIPDSLIKSELEFTSPHTLKANLLWTFEKKKNGMIVGWILEGKLAYPFQRWYGLFMKKTIVKHLEKGLFSFKNVVEKLPDFIGRTGEINITHFDGLIGLSIEKTSSINRIIGTMLTNYTTLKRYFKRNDIKEAGSPFTYYQELDSTYSNIVFDFGFPTEKKYAGEYNIKYIEIPAAKVVKAIHYGHFKTVQVTHDSVLRYMKANNLKQNGRHWDIYITNPLQEPNQSKWETHIYFPIK